MYNDFFHVYWSWNFIYQIIIDLDREHEKVLPRTKLMINFVIIVIKKIKKFILLPIRKVFILCYI